MNNVEPKYWGPHAWNFLYYVAISYPDNPTMDEKQNMNTFLQSLKNILPCEKCRNNYSRNLNNIRLTDQVLSNRYNLIHWLISLQNEIYKMNGRNKVITYDHIIKKYLTRKNPKIITLTNIGIMMVVILLIIKFYFLRKK